MKKIRYDELNPGDVILFCGAQEVVKWVKTFPSCPCGMLPREKYVRFFLKPANRPAVKAIGKFYASASYSGPGCVTVDLIKRAE